MLRDHRTVLLYSTSHAATAARAKRQMEPAAEISIPLWLGRMVEAINEQLVLRGRAGR